MGRAEKPTTETALALFDDLTPAKVYGTEAGQGLDAILQKITDEVRGTVIDVSTKPGREAAKSLAYKVARSKTALDDMGKELVSDWKTRSAKVDAERKTIRDRLDALKEEVTKPVVDWELLETGRVARHLNAITSIEDLARFEIEPTSAQVTTRLESLASLLALGRDWQEFADQAASAEQFILARLTALKQGAVKREADLAELDALRAEKAERDRKDQEAAEVLAVEQRAKAAAEGKRLAEEAAAARERIAAEQAVEAERLRIANAEAAEKAATAKREQNKKHRAKVIAAAIDALAEIVNRDDAILAIEAIVDGKIPAVTISF